MRVVLQRVLGSSVEVGTETVGQIGRGALVLVGIEQEDGPAEVEAIVMKLGGLRIFEDASGKTNLDIREIGGAFLVVSQFTLAATLAKGRRPSFDRAARPEKAEGLVEAVAEGLRALGHPVETGRFRAEMKVRLINDGPMTLILECRSGKIL